MKMPLAAAMSDINRNLLLLDSCWQAERKGEAQKC